MTESDENIYQAMRDKIVQFVERDLVGPSEENEVIEEAPTSRYSAGVLYPRLQAEQDTDSTVVTERAESLDNFEIDDEEVGVIEQTTSFHPSALGLSFSVASEVTGLSVEVACARYVQVSKGEFSPISAPCPTVPEAYFNFALFKEKFTYIPGKLTLIAPLNKIDSDTLYGYCEDKPIKDAIRRLYELNEKGWKRFPMLVTVPISLTEEQSVYSVGEEHLKVRVICKQLVKDGPRLCTISLVNSAHTDKRPADNQKSYFQASIKVYGGSPRTFLDMSRAELRLNDEEEASLRLLYRNKQFFSAGHGTSVDWTKADDGFASEIHTVTMPQFSVPEMDFTLLEPTKSDGLDLKMKTMAIDSDEIVLASLAGLTGRYSAWIDSLEERKSKLEPRLLDAADRHIQLCREAADRMEKGISLLKTDEQLMRAFRLANEAMLMQRIHVIELIAARENGRDEVAMPSSYSSEKPQWRPFQLAFILMSIAPVSDANEPSRNLVDLIWFPTGGGKTEAYLGLTAFTIFLRRLRHPSSKSGGTTVLMRYTLRLLTAQQFQRACTLICACEKIRNREKLGGDEISIGLWIGGGSTPNKVAEAERRYAELQRGSNPENPFQVLACPWCGANMTKSEGGRQYAYMPKTRPKRFTMYCPNTLCDYHDELPIRVIDEDIYNQPPTLLFGTVDKFAQLPWQENASKIFALNPGNENLSPELIIQDELHLISGSLGTMVGLYESAIDLMCSDKGVQPKIIASTATIRRAADQCRALFAREVRQFPAPGIDAEDSFFAREAAISPDKPGRLYVGVLPAGKTSTTMQVRLLSNLIQSVAQIDAPEEVKDKFWTQVIYCNSIRELGSSKSILYDDVEGYSSTLARRFGKKPRYFSNSVEELTSRIPAESIPAILQRLSNSLPGNVIDVLLATNMISVGVDIERLGLMMILGQPKTTSEYIQASSRVGRSFPGLVFTLLSPVKSRDRSHYEQFINYHQSLYRNVEPTSVTPFSAPVRDKALYAVMVTIIRHLVHLHKNTDIKQFDINDEGLRAHIVSLLDRVKKIDPLELDATSHEITAILERIKEVSVIDGALFATTAKPAGETTVIRKSDEKGTAYPAPTSMRSTDVECDLTLDPT